MPRPFRFGLSASAAIGGKDWRSRARRAEQLGYAVLSVPDHIGNQLAPFAAMQAAADATTTLRIGSYVLDNDHRHPVLLAQESATIDLLSGGRFELGIGAGHMKREYDAIGADFDRGADRIERLAEAIQIIRALLSGERGTFHGRHYRVEDALELPRPVQQPHPPILIGGGGQELLSIAARQAQIVSVVPRAKADGTGLDENDFGSASFSKKIAWVHAAAADRFAEVELNTLVQEVVVGNAQAGAEQLATEWDVTPEWVLDTPYALVGDVSQIEERLLEMRETYGISYVTVFEGELEKLAPLVARLAGA
jgi:probable F420-dependent oxidoreductase